ncbi:DUF547 domain-containing protein [Adhaeribacter pallidiroseus]|uniref:DUF547 domain-containing protein n=1 Tax=Adhaeribacter pallidiroseus TaxID=2072847 RepID=A0A369QFS7_9BACT|nr:DUF547 domain-containing protein [Adhaeribacter pallidiroseus]RDC63150.1 hypothetical protein AHMF7616_01751 [Adhaeribacter pallidiroseus]
MLFKILFILLITVVTFGNCSSDNKNYPSQNHSSTPAVKPVSHQLFSNILHKYVTPNGQVNYRGLLLDTLALNQYLQLLSRNPPANTWSTPEKLAYWLNAYNAFTLQLVLRHYPVKSIKDIGSKIHIPFVNTCWDISFIPIGAKRLSLNEIEHQILRKTFKEPRIHFAIVCASVSCPKLRNEAYSAANLHQQLEDQARTFINDPSRNQIRPHKIKISKIFSWFTADFTHNGPLIQYLNRYSTVQIKANAQVSNLDYNWRLNEINN